NTQFCNIISHNLRIFCVYIDLESYILPDDYFLTARRYSFPISRKIFHQIRSSAKTNSRTAGKTSTIPCHPPSSWIMAAKGGSDDKMYCCGSSGRDRLCGGDRLRRSRDGFRCRRLRPAGGGRRWAIRRALHRGADRREFRAGVARAAENSAACISGSCEGGVTGRKWWSQ